LFCVDGCVFRLQDLAGRTRCNSSSIVGPTPTYDLVKASSDKVSTNLCGVIQLKLLDGWGDNVHSGVCSTNCYKKRCCKNYYVAKCNLSWAERAVVCTVGVTTDPHPPAATSTI
jgi:hypothetical protein